METSCVDSFFVTDCYCSASVTKSKKSRPHHLQHCTASTGPTEVEGPTSARGTSCLLATLPGNVREVFTATHHGTRYYFPSGRTTYLPNESIWAFERAHTKKAMMVMVFLKYMKDRDDDQSHFKRGGKHASEIAAEVGELLGATKSSVYRAYKEWKECERLVADNNGPRRPGAFRHPTQGSHERRFY